MTSEDMILYAQMDLEEAFYIDDRLSEVLMLSSVVRSHSLCLRAFDRDLQAMLNSFQSTP